jgi:hypothetical protein
MVVGGRAIPSLVSHWWRRRREEKLITKTARCNSSARNFRTENVRLRICGAAASKVRARGGMSRSNDTAAPTAGASIDRFAVGHSMTASAGTGRSPPARRTHRNAFTGLWDPL